jgi:rhodanese-related sulfurtransferase
MLMLSRLDWVVVFFATQHSLVFVRFQLPKRLNELDKQQEIIMICHHEVRSQHAAQTLEQSGFTDISNLQGGIDAWSVLCDTSVPRY